MDSSRTEPGGGAEPLRVGIVGMGVIAPFYLAALERVPALRLAAVCDRDEETLRGFGDLGGVPRYRDHRELLRQAGLDAVVVTVPNHVHAEVCRDVLTAGLPVCVEKPLATELSDGAALVRFARAAGLPLFTVFHRRYNAEIRALAAALQGGHIPVDTVTIRYFERIEDHVGRDHWYLDPARCGGGCVADNGPNAYDLARLLTGPVRVAAADIVRDAHEVDRQARVLLHAESGARIRVELDWSYPGECKDVEVRLVDGTVHRADMLRRSPQSARSRSELTRFQPKSEESGFDKSGFDKSGFDKSGFKMSLWHEYVAALEDFAETVRARRERADAGLAMLALVHETYRLGRQVVALTEGR